MIHNRQIIRGVWGDFDNIRQDIVNVLRYNISCLIFVFGDKNMQELRSLGLDRSNCYGLHQVHNMPSLWDLKTEFWRHKLTVFEHASNLGLNEFLFLDWDCIPIKKFNFDDMWKTLNKKEIFQANLYQYHTKRCLWRNEDWRKVCNGGFVYFRNADIAHEIVQNWEQFKLEIESKRVQRLKKGKELRVRERYLLYDDEPAMSKWVANSSPKINQI